MQKSDNSFFLHYSFLSYHPPPQLISTDYKNCIQSVKQKLQPSQSSEIHVSWTALRSKAVEAPRDEQPNTGATLESQLEIWPQFELISTQLATVLSKMQASQPSKHYYYNIYWAITIARYNSECWAGHHLYSGDCEFKFYRPTEISPTHTCIQ